MKKLLLIFLISYLFPHTLLANAQERKVTLFNEWLSDNGFEQYLDKTSDNTKFKLDRSICKDSALVKDFHIIKKCYGADGSIIPNSELKFKKIYPNNLNIKFNKKKNNLSYKTNPNRDTLIYYFWNYSYRSKNTGSNPNLIKFYEKPYTFT